MRAVLQRVKSASVTVEGRIVGEIGAGVLALVAATHEDTQQDVAKMARKIADLRILSDDTSLSDHIPVVGSAPDSAPPAQPSRDGSSAGSAAESATASLVAPAALVVSQFTLYGTIRKGRRPSWSAAAPGSVAEPLVEAVAQGVRERGIEVATGVFGAQMDVELVNDGPFTLIVDT
ncbi:MAG: D-aminoacyl-tRNA deacylase [Ornithinimicrobium sp.]